MKNIHVLPTDKPSRLYLTTKEYVFEEVSLVSTDECQNKNIYITSDEEIKEGDWVICPMSIAPTRALKNEDYSLKNNWRKIILTTDQDLIEDYGIQVIDDVFLEWFVKNPSCEKVEIEKLPYDGTKSITKYWDGEYKIIIPKEEPKQETLKEVVKVERTELFNSIFSVVKQIPRKDVNGDAIDAISCAYEIEQLFYKWQQEQDKKMFSEEDMQSLIKIRNYFGENDKTFFEHFAYSFLDRIIEQFKNK